MRTFSHTKARILALALPALEEGKSTLLRKRDFGKDVSAHGVAEAQLAGGVFARAFDAIVARHRAGGHSPHGNLGVVGADQHRPEHGVVGPRAELTLDAAAPTIEAATVVDAATVKSIDSYFGPNAAGHDRGRRETLIGVGQ